MTPRRPPELHLVLPLEGRVAAFVTVTNSAEADGLRDWLVANEDDLREQVAEVLDQIHAIRSTPEGGE